MSQGIKFDDGKPAMELIDAEAMEDLARVLEFGRRKYGAHNWRGGMDANDILVEHGVGPLRQVVRKKLS
jgi:hypothetical protein